MRFALLGDHVDGLAMARALAESERHELAVFSGSPVGWEYLRRWNLACRRVGDLEEVLADPKLTAVIVAGSAADRPNQLRRALQAEFHVLCVHPADDSPDIAYEAAMIQADTHKLLFPLLPEALHPGLQRLAEVMGHADAEMADAEMADAKMADAKMSGRSAVAARTKSTAITAQAPAAGDSLSPRDGFLPRDGFGAPPMSIRLIELERWSTEGILLDADQEGHKPGLPGWDVLRFLGGEIVEVWGLATGEDLSGEEPLLVAGRFERGGLFQMSLLPQQPQTRWRLRAVASHTRAELVFPEGWPGPACLTWTDAGG